MVSTSADSYCFNPHKWMFTNFDCDAFFVADRKALIDTLSILPEYLRNAATGSGAVIDYRDWQIPLGRRFRALKLWFVIRHYGIEGLQHHVRKHVEMTRDLVGWVEADDRFVVAAPVPLNLVCFRHRGGDAVNQQIMDHVNGSGELYLTHTKLDGQLTLRLCIGQTHTEPRHVRAAWVRLCAAADAVESEPSDIAIVCSSWVITMTAIKICGITNFTDAEVAARAGADLLGFILYPKSPRYIEPERVAVIVARLHKELEPPLPQLVGVFVNVVAAEVQQVLVVTGLDLAQLHGDETADEVGGTQWASLQGAAPQRAGRRAGVGGIVRRRQDRCATPADRRI